MKYLIFTILASIGDVAMAAGNVCGKRSGVRGMVQGTAGSAVKIDTTTNALGLEKGLDCIQNRAGELGVLGTSSEIVSGEAWSSAFQYYANVATSAVAFIVFGLILYGGFLYLTAGVNEDNRTKGINILKYAVIGMVIIAFAFTIVNFVFGSLETNL